MNNAPPACKGKTTSQIVAENLNAAKQAFIQSESAEKLQRASWHQVRTYGDTKYFTGDAVNYKRKDDAWKAQLLDKKGTIFW